MPDGAGDLPETGHYVYGVVPASGERHLPLHGIDDAEVAFVERRELAAATATPLPAKVFV